MSGTFRGADMAGTIGAYLLRAGLQQRPHHLAVINGSERWTYQQLADAATTLADDLANRGVKPGSVIVIESDPSPLALITILACSVLRAIFVPIAPQTPLSRREAILNMTDPVAFASERQLRQPASTPISIGMQQGNFAVTGEVDGLEQKAYEAPPDSAYILFTSGTTGTPKGITMSHRAVTAFFRGVTHQLQLQPDTRLATYSPLSFDIALFDWGLVGTVAATLVQTPRMLLHHPRRFVQYLKRNDVTMVSGVPSIWQPVLRHAADDLAQCTSLAAVHLGGEGYSLNLVHALRQARPGLRIFNGYGQSESIACSFVELPDPIPVHMTRVPIGPAHPGAELLVVNEQGQPTQVGETGELFLRSKALFSGYWRDEEITNRVMVPPRDRPDSHERVLRTGDLLRREPDGLFSFVGRIDHQVKVNGNRVELEEIEEVLTADNSVKEAVVTVIRDASGDHLVAIVVIAGSRRDDVTGELIGACRKALPPYMVPNRIVYVSAIPRNERNKIDRRAAHELALKLSPRNSVSFQNPG